jgi:anti-anti-sigma factor
MEIKVSSENGRVPVTIIHIDGNLDSSTYSTFQAKAEELIQSGTSHILVDLTHSPYVSSAGLRAFHQIFKDLNAVHLDANPGEQKIKQGISDGTYKSPYLKLLHLSEETRLVFKTSGFDIYMEAFDDLKTAVAAF